MTVGTMLKRAAVSAAAATSPYESDVDYYLDNYGGTIFSVVIMLYFLSCFALIRFAVNKAKKHQVQALDTLGMDLEHAFPVESERRKWLMEKKLELELASAFLNPLAKKKYLTEEAEKLGGKWA